MKPLSAASQGGQSAVEGRRLGLGAGTRLRPGGASPVRVFPSFHGGSASTARESGERLVGLDDFGNCALRPKRAKSCAAPNVGQPGGLLPSWNEGPAKGGGVQRRSEEVDGNGQASALEPPLHRARLSADARSLELPG